MSATTTSVLSYHHQAASKGERSGIIEGCADHVEKNGEKLLLL